MHRAVEGAEVVLTVTEDAAHHRVPDRMNALWTSNDPLARWLY